ncbi:transposase [Sinomicrobium weinanense]|uniref:Transposase n=1 Tax=Sinomicrobium weinanense TaxID=2842200 RepID=A0A926Q2N7_9FLAO|nr:transposase [Sinomicrobium weinanense]MBC9794860.1 transposase [Sinomicrobium weinanense]MBU3125631.1 transposase [Sinomicrobium weinanense]
MYKVLDKDTIEMEIVPNIPMPSRGFPPRVEPSEIVNAVLYKMKTGVQWEYLPVTALFAERALTWQGVYYHFRKWCLKDINTNVCFNKRNGNVDREEYFDQELYNLRYAIERTNAWMDGFRSLLNRFDTITESWKGFNYLCFVVLTLKKSR